MSTETSQLSKLGIDEAMVKRLLDLPDPIDSVPKSVAVQRCEESWLRSQLKAMIGGADALSARTGASDAYCRAMPPLVGSHNIRDFIACVSHGVLIGVIKAGDSAKLLYAAQVALAAQKAVSNT